MTDGETNTANRDLQALFEGGSPGVLSDGQLLDRFVSRQEATVFEVIVHRHGPMVWGVCRRVLRDHHDAEDAFQATFLVLARRAASVKPRDKVGHWLYGVAYQTAMKARTMRARRRVRESQVASILGPAEAEAARELRDSLAESLDRELGRLPEKYRVPLVLCELEGKTHREASEQLGWPVGTVSGRLSRAKAMLARRLSRRGVSLTVGTLGAMLAQETASAGPPARIVASTARAASLFAAGRVAVPGVVSAEVAALTGEVLKMMMLTKLKTIVLALLVVSLTGAVGLVRRAPASGARSQGPGERPPVQDARPEGPRPEAARAPVTVALAQDRAAEPMVSHPFKLDPEVVELAELTVDYGDFHLKAGPVSVVPISSEPGITGAMVIGKGTYRYTPTKDVSVEGQFRAAMLRFNPAEQAAIVPLAKGKRVSDRGILEMSRHMLQVVIRHCWQSNKDGGRRQEVLIPPKGAFAAVLYSKEHGDLLISFGDRSAIAFSFSDRKALYEKK